MATSPARAQHSLEEVLSSSFWNRQRNRILGITAAVLIALLVVYLVRQRQHDRAAQAWEALLSDEAFVPEAPSAAELERVAGTSAEPYALLMEAREAIEEDEFARAETAAARLVADFPEHLLVRNGTAQKLLDFVRGEREWHDQHALVEENPEPNEEANVTLATALGEIRIALYPQTSPKSVSRFLHLVRNGDFAGASLAEFGFGGGLVMAPPKPEETNDEAGEKKGDSGEEQGEKTEVNEGAAAAKGYPLDRNELTHEIGAVSLQREGAPSPTADAPSKVFFCLGAMPMLDDRQIVFGKVIAGLELLEQVAERDRSETNPMLLAEPLEITSITESEAAKALQ